ncbi:MAG: hypothetical protein ACE15C_03160 [Phycisphaerae bacterium]
MNSGPLRTLSSRCLAALWAGVLICAVWVCVAGPTTAAPPIIKPPAGAKAAARLHFLDSGTRITNWNHRMTDGGQYLWDIQTTGAVGQGTNYAYSGGLYLTMNGNGFGGNTGVVNKAGDEIELGTWNWQSVRVSRRIKVYKDRALARWLDIYENDSPQEQTLQIQTHINCNWNINKTTTSSGQGTFGEKDFAFITESPSGGNPNPPSLCHIVCDKRSKARPTIQVQGNQIYVRWTLTLPARGAAIICHFESQNNSVEEQQKLMASFQANKLLRDLPGSVRKLIVNFKSAGGFEDVDLDRGDKYDSVQLVNGDPIYGTVLNKSFAVEASFGAMTLPADHVVGMAAVAKDDEKVRFLLKDGQIICGNLPADKLEVQLTAGGSLQIPFDRISQWSYRISDAKPYDLPPTGAVAMLRTGDRLAFDPAAVTMMLRTRYGEVPLDPKVVARIAMDNTGNAIHRAQFTNGSSLGGFLEPTRIGLKLKLGQSLELSRDLVAEVQFSGDVPDPAPQTSLTLSNGDELLGRLADEKLNVKTDFGPVEVTPQNIKQLTFNTSSPGRAVLELWDGTKGLQGDMEQQELTFEMIPGPVVKVPTGQIVSLVSPFALPPDDVLKQVGALIDQLGSETWKERQKATDELLKIGPSVIPILQGKLTDRDAEVRQRVEEILEKLNAKPTPTPAPRGPRRVMGAMPAAVQVEAK